MFFEWSEFQLFDNEYDLTQFSSGSSEEYGPFVTYKFNLRYQITGGEWRAYLCSVHFWAWGNWVTVSFEGTSIDMLVNTRTENANYRSITSEYTVFSSTLFRPGLFLGEHWDWEGLIRNFFGIGIVLKTILNKGNWNAQ